MIQTADLESLLVAYGKKIMMGEKQLNAETFKSRELANEIKSMETKIGNFKKEQKDNENQSDKINSNN